MKRLIAIATLGLALGFSSLSFASDYMSLYTGPVANGDVRNEANGGNVERDFMSFYTSPRPATTQPQLISDQFSDEDYTTIFGVRIAL